MPPEMGMFYVGASIFFMILSRVLNRSMQGDSLVVPLAGNHTETVASDGAEVGDRVETAVDVGECLVKRYIERGQLVVVAKQTLQEGLVGKIECRKIVVGAVDILQVRATLNRKGGEVIVGANQIKKCVAVADSEGGHVVVGADESRERRKARYDEVRNLVVIDV